MLPQARVRHSFSGRLCHARQVNAVCASCLALVMERWSARGVRSHTAVPNPKAARPNPLWQFGPTQRACAAFTHVTMSAAMNALRRAVAVAPQGARAFQSSAARLGGHADEPVRPRP